MDIKALLESIADPSQPTQQLDEARSLADINYKATKDMAAKKLEPQLNSHKKAIEQSMKAIKSAIDSNQIGKAIDSADGIRKSLEAMRTLISKHNTAIDGTKILSDATGKGTHYPKMIRKAQLNAIRSIKESCDTYQEYAERLEEILLDD